MQEIQDIKILLRAYNSACALGVDEYPLAVTAHRLRDEMIKAIGLRQYIHAMLGRQAAAPAGHVVVYNGNGCEEVPAACHDMPLVDYLMTLSHLPHKVQVVNGAELVL